MKVMRRAHINDIAHCWWHSKWMFEQHLASFRDPRWPTTPYHSTVGWSFSS